MQPVRDGDHRTALQYPGERTLQVPGGPRVEQRGGLVQHQGVRVRQMHPGQGELLCLGGLQFDSARAQRGVQARRQFGHPVRFHRPQGREHGLVVGLGRGHGHVVAQGAHEHVVLLREEDDAVAQSARRGLVGDGHAADQHVARVRDVRTGQQLAEGGLAGSRPADHRQPFTGTDQQLHVLEDLLPGDVGIPHALDLDDVVHRVRHSGAGCVRHQPDTLDAGERGAAALQLFDLDEQLVERVDQLPHVQAARHHGSQGDRAVEVAEPAHEQDERHGQRVRELRDREQHRPQGEGAHAGAVGGVDGLVEGAVPQFAQPVGLDGTGAVRGGVEDLGDLAGGRSLREVGVAGAREVPAAHAPHDRQSHDRAETEQRVQEEDRGEDEHDLDAGDEHVRSRGAQRGRDGRDVQGGPRDQITGAHLVRDPPRQREGALDDLLAEPGERALAEAVGEASRVARQHQSGRRAAQHRRGQSVDGGGGQVTGLGPGHDAAEEPGTGRAGERGEACQQQHRADGARVVPQQLPAGPANRPGIGDRQAGRPAGAAHRDCPSTGCATAASPGIPVLPRNTSAAYPGWSARSSRCVPATRTFPSTR